VRWSVDKHLLISANYTKTKVENLTAIGDGVLFSFFGIEDLKGINPALFLGGQPIGLVPIPNANASRRAGLPEDLYSATATYSFDNGLAFSGSISRVPSVFSGQSQVVRLPAYTLVDAGASFTTGPWLFRAVVKNATNAKYFRANFTELFGATIALPERPRNWQASVVSSSDDLTGPGAASHCTASRFPDVSFKAAPMIFAFVRLVPVLLHS